MFGISNEKYIKSIGIDTLRNTFFDKLSLMLSENSSGKSGSFFFHTSDGKYMVKTIHPSEFDILRSTLYSYY
jgi:1-phosphatidylinositol-4-phosphate 5-kinase